MNLDPRISADGPPQECFMCAKDITRNNWVAVETGASPQLLAHESCVNNMPALTLYTRYWKALRAAMRGERESPNPAPARVRGAFQ